MCWGYFPLEAGERRAAPRPSLGQKDSTLRLLSPSNRATCFQHFKCRMPVSVSPCPGRPVISAGLAGSRYGAHAHGLTCLCTCPAQGWRGMVLRPPPPSRLTIWAKSTFRLQHCPRVWGCFLLSTETLLSSSLAEGRTPSHTLPPGWVAVGCRGTGGGSFSTLSLPAPGCGRAPRRPRGLFPLSQEAGSDARDTVMQTCPLQVALSLLLWDVVGNFGV